MTITVGSRVLVAALTASVGVIAAGVTYAAIPDSGGVIHGCYNPNGAQAPNGTTLNILDSAEASCKNNQTEITWNQTGPPGSAGSDGVSVTSTSLAAGDANCTNGGSQFTAAGASVTYACNGLDGATGATGAAGPSAAYTNYGDGFHSLAAGTTQTVASATVPAGSYVLYGAVQAISVGDLEFAQCFFIAPGATVNGRTAVMTSDESESMLADVTLPTANSIILRCNAQGGTVETAGQMIATLTGTVTAS
jgi:hypothetical protein